MGDVGGLTCKIMRCTFNEEPDHSQQAMDRHSHDVHLCVVHVHGSHGVAGGRAERKDRPNRWEVQEVCPLKLISLQCVREIPATLAKCI